MPGEYLLACIIVDRTIEDGLVCNKQIGGRKKISTVDQQDADDDNESNVEVEDKTFESTLELIHTEMHQMDTWWEIVVVPVDFFAAARAGGGSSCANSVLDLCLYNFFSNIEFHL